MRKKIDFLKSFSIIFVLGFWSSLGYADNKSEIRDALNSGEDKELNVKKLLAKKFSEKNKNLDLSYVEPDDNDANGGWNAKYNLKYGTSSASGFSADADRFELDAYSAELDISGSYSFGDATNTDDLSTVNFSLSYLNVDLGPLTKLSEAQNEALQMCRSRIFDPKIGDFTSTDAFIIAADKAEAQINDCYERFDKRPSISKPANPRSYSFDIHGLVEGNQDYSSRNVAYGIQGLYSAEGYPSFRFDLERVDASENEARAEITSDDEYDRVSGEIGYRYKFAEGDGYPFWLHLSYRVFHEVSAPREIKREDLDTFEYIALSVHFPAAKFGLVDSKALNLFVRYTDGQLPFDRESDQAVELGFTTNIEVLKSLLE